MERGWSQVRNVSGMLPWRRRVFRLAGESALRLLAALILLLSSLPITVLVPYVDFGVPRKAEAASFTVNSTADAVDANPADGVCETATGNGVCTLRAAIQTANAVAGADTITLPAGTYTLSIPGAAENAGATGDLDLTENLTITGAGAGSTMIDGNGVVTGDRVLQVVGSGVIAQISGVTIRGGKAPTATTGGGINNQGNLTLTGVTVTQNSAGISGDTAGATGGGISNPTGATLTIVDSTISSNTAFRTGGGIQSSGTLTLTNSTVTQNTGANGAGGISVASGVTATLNSSSVTANNATGASGNGGGIGSSGNLTLNDSTIDGNTAALNGGGISMSGQLTINRSTVSGNTASTFNGGGVAMSFGSSVTVLNSTFSGNTASSNGGGVSNFQGTLTVASSTFSANSATGVGGGISTDPGTATAVTSIKNSIVANSPSGGNCGGPNAVTSGGYNLSSDSSCAFAGTGDRQSIDPLLGSLSNYGGPTLTHVLLGGSPATNAIPFASCTDTSGAALTIDQRSMARPQFSGCDIGSHELQETTGPAIKLAPRGGPAGTIVSADGSGFTPGAMVHFMVDSASNPIIAMATPDSGGNFLATFPIPLGTSSGNHTILAGTAPGSYIVGADMVGTLPAGAPALFLAPKAALAGQSITASATGLGASESQTFTWVNPHDTLAITSGTPSTGADGSLGNVTFSVPGAAAQGGHAVTVMGGTSGRSATARLAIGTVDIHLDPASATVAANGTVDVGIVLNSGALLVDGVEAYLHFDQNRLAVVDAGGSPATSITLGTCDLPTPIKNEVDNVNGTIHLGRGVGTDPATSPIGGSCTLGTIRLKDKAGTSGTALVTFALEPDFPATTAVLDAVRLLVATTNGSVTVSSGLTITAFDFTSTPTSQIGQGATRAATITGTGYQSGATVAVSGTEVTVSSVVVNSATSISATITASGSAPTGPRSVTVTNPNSESYTRSNAFTVNVAPTVASITPTSAVAGSGVTTVTITGTGFVSGATVTSTTTATATVGATTFVSDTSLTVPVTPLAAGTTTFTVTNPDSGAATSGTFTVTAAPAAVSITSISPTSRGLNAGTTTVTITGTGFVSGATVTSTTPGTATVGATTFVSATSLTVPVTPVAAGTTTFVVTNPDTGTATSTVFTVTPAPTVTSISPSSAVAGSGVTTVTITGTNFQSGATVTSTNTATATVGATTFVSATSLTVPVTPVASGTTTFVVMNPDGGTATSGTFTVTAAPSGPTITSINPTSRGLNAGTTTVTITGTGFVSGATVTSTTPGTATVGATTFVSDTSLTVPVTPVAVGTTTFVVTNSDSSAATSPVFTVTPAPTVTGISPTSIAQGATSSYAITGTGFQTGATVAVSGTGVTASSVVVNSSTSITATLTATNTAATGTRDVTITNADGGTGTSSALLTVNPLEPGAGEVFVDPSVKRIPFPGGSRSVTLKATAPVQGLASWTIQVIYDPSVVTATGCTTLAGTAADCAFDFAANTVQATGASSITGGETGTVSIADITFSAVSSARRGSATDLVVSIITFEDPAGAPIVATKRNGQIMLGCLPYDVNCNGSVTSQDALCVLRKINNRPTISTCPADSEFDATRKGGISSTDALGVLRRINQRAPTNTFPALTLVLQPSSGSASTTFAATASALFQLTGTAEFRLDTATGPLLCSASIATDKSVSASSCSIPVGTSVGLHTVHVVVGGAIRDSADFTVTE